MPSAGDYQTLNLMGAHIQGFQWKGEALRCSYGSGYGSQALVGVAHGLHRFMILGKCLPDETVLMPNGQTWFRYYYDFFIARTTGTEPNFLINWRQKVWHVRFADMELDYEVFRNSLYAGGHTLEQVRVRSFFSYFSDGSVNTG
jgi:hypothetical protein